MSTPWTITGGCGFIGRNLIHRLLGNTPVGIRVIDNLSTSTIRDLDQVCSAEQVDADAPAPPPGQVQVVAAELADAKHLTRAVLPGSVVVNLAANTGVPLSVVDPITDFHSNTLGVFNLLEACRTRRAVRVVQASSGAPTGECVPPVTEQVVPRPVSPYGASKLAGEGYCCAYFHAYGLETVALRFSNVYGPYSTHKTSVVAKFINDALSGQPWTVYGDGRQTRDFLHVDDLVESILAAAVTPGVGGEVFQIATGHETSLVELVEMIAVPLLQRGIEPVGVTHEASRAGDIVRNYADPSKAARLLAWKPRKQLREGLAATVDWFLDQQQG